MPGKQGAKCFMSVLFLFCNNSVAAAINNPILQMKAFSLMEIKRRFKAIRWVKDRAEIWTQVFCSAACSISSVTPGLPFVTSDSQCY